MNNDYKERMLLELVDLTTKIARLDAYLNNNNATEVIEPNRKELMEHQLKSMYEYRECLIRRVIIEMGA